jgi:hypothetical protein
MVLIHRRMISLSVLPPPRSFLWSLFFSLLARWLDCEFYPVFVVLFSPTPSIFHTQFHLHLLSSLISGICYVAQKNPLFFDMLISETLFVALFLSSSAYAGLNDWNKPCLDGVCYWDHPQSSTGPNAGSSGSMKIVRFLRKHVDNMTRSVTLFSPLVQWGSQDAVTDVTEAAGWSILDCDPNSFNQTIRIACMHSNEQEAGCSHLFRNTSPVGKIVRLPDNVNIQSTSFITGSKLMRRHISVWKNAVCSCRKLFDIQKSIHSRPPFEKIRCSCQCTYHPRT